MGTAIVTINSSSSYKKNDMSNKEARKITCSRKVNCHCYSKFWLHKQTHYRCRRYWPNFKQWRLWQWWCKHKQRLRQWEQPNIFHSQRSTTFSALSFKSQDKEKKTFRRSKEAQQQTRKEKKCYSQYIATSFGPSETGKQFCTDSYRWKDKWDLSLKSIRQNINFVKDVHKLGSTRKS